ncbi:MAG: P-II family nitrogen regulator [Eubacteriales bacterium]|nr:P-II family nitrogen regulator [Eubacteriales bacterium]
MKMLRAIIRPEMADHVADALLEAGYPSMTRMEVYGRGKQMGLQVGSTFYDELPKHMILMVVHDEDVDTVADIIMQNAFTGDDGNYGDGRIFVSPVLKAYTVSTQSSTL